MIALALMLALSASSPSPRVARCEGIVHTTRAMITARRKGVTQDEAVQVVDETLDGDDRTTARVLIWYVYVANSDKRTPPAKVIELVRRACMSNTTNALTGDE